jgi:quinol monooxygenase YgiN
MRITLHLRLRIAPERRGELFAFLKMAVPYYEAPGGIRVRLLESRDDPSELLEIVEYDSIASYAADEIRVETDPRMLELLDHWRRLLSAPPEVDVYHDITSDILPRADTA